LIGIDTSALIAFEDKMHADHARMVQLIRKRMKSGERLVLCPQVVAEFLHVATDGRRFAAPLTMVQALSRAEWWRSVRECRWVYPDEASVELFLGWMTAHRLGRKRILDTLLAATYAAQGVTKLATLNIGDFEAFDRFEFVT
jgi:predicted nucleic acid-binding protein